MKKIFLAAAATLLIVAPVTAQTRYEKTYTDSKQLSVEGTLNDAGKRTGQWTWWYPTGQMSQQGSYLNGQKTGTRTFYYEDGSRMAEECHGTGVSRSWYRNGDLKSEVNVENGKKNGLYRSWHDNGQVEEEITYVNGSREGETSQWHNTGQLKFCGLYRNNELQGKGTWWLANGRLDMEGNLVDGEQDGVWKFYWRTNGKLGIQGS